MSRVAGPVLKSEKIERFIQAAASTVGVRPTALDRRRMQECAEALLSAQHEVQKISLTLKKLPHSSPAALAPMHRKPSLSAFRDGRTRESGARSPSKAGWPFPNTPAPPPISTCSTRPWRGSFGFVG
jgi:hypothetical protein